MKTESLKGAYISKQDAFQKQTDKNKNNISMFSFYVFPNNPLQLPPLVLFIIRNRMKKVLTPEKKF